MGPSTLSRVAAEADGGGNTEAQLPEEFRMNQTSTAAAIATVIGAYTGLIGMVGFLMYVTRSKVLYGKPRRHPAAQVGPIDAPAGEDGQLVGPRRAADDVVNVGR
jgi:hypothetical protein